MTFMEMDRKYGYIRVSIRELEVLKALSLELV